MAVNVAVPTGTGFEEPVAACIGSRVRQQMRELQDLVEMMHVSWVGTRPLVPLRRSHRVRCEQPLSLVPLNDDSLQPSGPPLRVCAWDLCGDGLSFTHGSPLACRLAALTFELPDGTLQSMLARLKWCRFTKSGFYRSGGQFLRPIPTPPETQCDFSGLLAG